MNKINERIAYFFSAKGQFSFRRRLGLYNNLSDEEFVKKMFKAYEGREINLDNPRTLNEKLQWLKLNNRKDIYTSMSDKIKAKEYVAKIIGDKYIIPTLGTWSSPNDIDFDKLPNKFVIKCNHNSGTGMYICKDKNKADIHKIKTELQKGLDEDYYSLWREWPYKNVERKIIAEQYLENVDGSAIVDYKFYCYGEKPRYFMYSVGEACHNVRNHKFDMNYQSIDYLFKKNPTINLSEIELPNNIDEMVSIVEKLCKGHQHIRIDLYNVNGKIYFGEMTFYTSGGFINIDNKEYSQQLADYIDISKII